MARDSSKNWFKVYRDLLTEELWTSEKFTTGQAWVDLIGMANYADVEKIYKGQFQQVRRGQIVTSIRALAERWHWSREKTNRTLKSFEMAKMLTMTTTTNGTVLTLENYDKYQGGQATKPTTNLATDLATTLATEPTHKKKDKEGLKKEKNTGSASTSPDVPPAGYEVVDLPDGGTRYKPKGGKR